MSKIIMSIMGITFLRILEYFGVEELKNALRDINVGLTGTRPELAQRVYENWLSHNRKVEDLLDYLDRNILADMCQDHNLDYKGNSEVLKRRIKKDLKKSSPRRKYLTIGGIISAVIVLIALGANVTTILDHFDGKSSAGVIARENNAVIQSNGQAGGITAGQVIINNNVEDNAILKNYTSIKTSSVKSTDYAIPINQQLTKGPFQILVTQVGLYTPDSYGNTIQYFRVDMQVKNIGNSTENFLTNPIAIVDDKGNQYEEIPLGSLFVGFDMFPKTVKNGTMLFQTIPGNIKNVKLVFHLHDEDYNPLNFQYNFSLK